MTLVLVVVAAVVVVALAALLVAWAGHRMLTTDGPRGGGGTSGALGGFIDVFDPSRARADEDLESHKKMGALFPTPDEADHPVWKVDLHHNSVRIPRQP